MDIAQEMLTTFNYDSDLLKKVITGEPNGSVQKSQDRKKHVKLGKKDRTVISNNTLKLCADYATQFVRNTQNCGKTNYDKVPDNISSMLVCVFLAKNKTVISLTFSSSQN